MKPANTDLYARVVAVGLKRVKNDRLREIYVEKMYKDLGGTYVDEEAVMPEKPKLKIRAPYVPIKETINDGSVKRIVKEIEVKENGEKERKKYSQLVGRPKKLKVSQNGYAYSVVVKGKEVRFGKSTIRNVKRNHLKIRNRVINAMDKAKRGNPSCSEFWDELVCWNLDLSLSDEELFSGAVEEAKRILG